MFRPRHLLLAGLLCAGLPPAGADQAAVTWLCSVSEEGTRLLCLADVEPGAAPAAVADTAVVRGVRFPLRPSGLYTVDLWSPPTEAAFVRELAQATICYRSPGCTVTVAPGPWLRVASAR